MKRTPAVLATVALFLCFRSSTAAQSGNATTPAPAHPWMNKSLAPDDRADLLLRQLTLDQKIQLMHGTGDPHEGPPDPHASDGNGGSGFVPGIPELELPGIQLDDSAYGVAYSAGSGRYSTALPSPLALAATWDTSAAQRYGALIGQELRDQGYNMTLGGGVNLMREPRNGRSFEYQGEDPVLSGVMVGNLIKGVQSTHVIGDIKHFAVNDQESGRHAVSSVINDRAARESDLLAFELGVKIGEPGAVMCAYNRVNAQYACENQYLLSRVLKHDWHYRGFVVSDWLATHSTELSSRAGLDQEQPGNTFYGPALKLAVTTRKISGAELDEHVHRILRSMFASGVVDDPPKKQVPDVFRHAQIARQIEQQSIVLLRNQPGALPLDSATVHTIAVIGRNADIGMISGGGSAQVDPPHGNAIGDIAEKDRKADWQRATWFPDSPLAAIKAAAPLAEIRFNDGADPAAAAAAARGADVVLLYAYQWQAEGIDLPTLHLPDGQDALVEAVAAANPHTIVVLQTGGPVLMPWISHVAGVLETWYSGTMGADAIADILFGTANPTAKLPVTFPLADSDLPHPTLIGPPPASQEDWTDSDKMSRKLLQGLPPFSVTYDEGLEVGYKWYDAKRKPVLFPFGFGLSYTTFTYSGLTLDNASNPTLHFSITNTGKRAGDEIAQVYSTMPAATGEPPKRLIGWTRVSLAPGETKPVSITIDHERFSLWDERQQKWTIAPGTYSIMVGPGSGDLPLTTNLTLPTAR